MKQPEHINMDGTESSYSTSLEPQHALKEQLRLFAFNDTPLPTSDFLLQIQQKLSKRERLSVLLQGELNFHGENSGYASHDLHAFAAKFPPQLPKTFIRGLTNQGDFVLDPMMGSGTTVVEALLEGRKGIGLDIDPLALRLSRVKTKPLDIIALEEASKGVISRSNNLLLDSIAIERELNSRFDKRTKEFIDYWFSPATQRELMALVLAIQTVNDTSSRGFLELTFSSIIVTKSGGVSRARDLAHSRPHLDKTKIPKNAIEQFSTKVRKNIHSIGQLKSNGTNAAIIDSDARIMPIEEGVIDLIVTSPPYANAIDYMRAHKFSLVWLGESVGDLSELRATYLGSERVGHPLYMTLPNSAEIIIKKLIDLDNTKAAILRKYFIEMKSVIKEMFRVLRHDSVAIIIVGTSVMRGLDVQTHLCLADIASELGFEVVGVVQRKLDRNKRMMPARFGKKTDSMIEQRMHEEYVIGVLKP